MDENERAPFCEFCVKNNDCSIQEEVSKNCMDLLKIKFKPNKNLSVVVSCKQFEPIVDPEIEERRRRIHQFLH